MPAVTNLSRNVSTSACSRGNVSLKLHSTLPMHQRLCSLPADQAGQLFASCLKPEDYADVRHDKVLQDCDNSCKQRGYLTLGHPGLLAQRCMKGIASHSTVQSCTSCQYYSGPQTHSTSPVWLLPDVSHICMHQRRTLS